MSYRFYMGFKSIEKDDMFDFCLKFVNECAVNAKEFLENEKYYIPSINFDAPSKRRNPLDEMWLYDVFRFKFVYWDEKELLSIVGSSYPESAKKMFTMFQYFQNSTDQDYEYDSWKGIEFFENIVSETKAMNKEDLVKNDYDVDIEDIEEDIEYHKKSYIYNCIYKQLDLNNWLYGRYGNFKRFCLSGIDSQERYFELCKILRNIKENIE